MWQFKCFPVWVAPSAGNLYIDQSKRRIVLMPLAYVCVCVWTQHCSHPVFGAFPFWMPLVGIKNNFSHKKKVRPASDCRYIVVNIIIINHQHVLFFYDTVLTFNCQSWRRLCVMKACANKHWRKLGVQLSSRAKENLQSFQLSILEETSFPRKGALEVLQTAQ